jgi:peptide maturation system protein (TIGR04066 family)
MCKHKIVVYPYDDQFTPVLRHQDLLQDYEVVGLVSPKGWGLTGRDAGEADNGSPLGISVTSDFEGSLECCDAVLFSESRIQLEFRQYLMPKVMKAIEAGKDILFTSSLTDDLCNEILKACTDHSVDFIYYPETRGVSRGIAGDDDLLCDIDTPVIFVLGTGERTNKFEIQLALRENIMKMGYKVSQVGTREYCELLGFHSFPRFMFGDAISETSKIVSFNRFIKGLERNECPDVIIIGIPGGIMPFNNSLPNRFGILAYEVSQAVTPDSTVYSCYYSEYTPEYFSKMIDTLKYRLGCKVDCYNMSNNIFDWVISRAEGRIAYTSSNSRFIDEKLKAYEQLELPVFNVLSSEGIARMVDCLINKLSEYGETECI